MAPVRLSGGSLGAYSPPHAYLRRTPQVSPRTPLRVRRRRRSCAADGGANLGRIAPRLGRADDVAVGWRGVPRRSGGCRRCLGSRGPYRASAAGSPRTARYLYRGGYGRLERRRACYRFPPSPRPPKAAPTAQPAGGGDRAGLHRWPAGVGRAARRRTTCCGSIFPAQPRNRSSGWWRRKSASTSPVGGSTPRSTRFVALPGHTTADSPRAGTSRIFPPPCSACSARPVMGFTNRACGPMRSGFRLARRLRLAFTSLSRGSGRISSLARSRFGSGACRW